VIVRVKAISGLIEAICVPGNVDEVPSEGFSTIATNSIGPTGNFSKVIVAKQLNDGATGRRGEPLTGDIPNESMAFRSPCKAGSGGAEYEN
jgi:hypothetical protein